MIRLGYPCVNIELKDKGIVTDKKVKLKTVYDGENLDLDKLIEISNSNLDAFYKILEWNEKNNIKLYRASSNLFPHITNTKLLYTNDYKELVYPLSNFTTKLKKIGTYIKKHKHRVTFHPDPFLSLGSKDPTNAIRELHFHTKLIEALDLDFDSVIVIHGGGLYENKSETIQKWIKNFNSLPINIKRRIVLENDEFSYSLDDVIYISKNIKPFTINNMKSSIPIVLDIFHYECYKDYQIPIPQAIPLILESWNLTYKTTVKSRTVKMHISNQRPDSRLGAHADYVKELPPFMLNFPKHYRRNLDIMIEAKAKEDAVYKLRLKYPVH